MTNTSNYSVRVAGWSRPRCWRESPQGLHQLNRQTICEHSGLPTDAGPAAMLLDAEHIQVFPIRSCNVGRRCRRTAGKVRAVAGLDCRPVSRSCERVLPISPRACTRVLLYWPRPGVVASRASRSRAGGRRRRSAARSSGNVEKRLPNQTSHHPATTQPRRSRSGEVGVETGLCLRRCSCSPSTRQRAASGQGDAPAVQPATQKAPRGGGLQHIRASQFTAAVRALTEQHRQGDFALAVVFPRDQLRWELASRLRSVGTGTGCRCRVQAAGSGQAFAGCA